MALKNLIVKNNSGSDQLITDLGIVVANSSQETYTELSDIRRALASASLRAMAKAGTLVLNDGNSDISPSEVDDFIQYHDTGAPNTALQIDSILINASGEVLASKTGNLLVTG